MDIEHLPPQTIVDLPAVAERAVPRFDPSRVQITNDFRGMLIGLLDNDVAALVGAGEVLERLIDTRRLGGVS